MCFVKEKMKVNIFGKDEEVRTRTTRRSKVADEWCHKEPLILEKGSNVNHG